MGSRLFDQICCFTTDSYGLERLLRLVQASVQIILSFVLSSSLVNSFISPSTDLRRLRNAFHALRGQLGVVRRFFRLFRFLDSFKTSHTILARISHDSPEPNMGSLKKSKFLEHSLQAAASTFNGGYLLLESITIIDALGIHELAIWGPGWERVLKIESQRFWFLALASGAAVSLLKIIAIRQTLDAAQHQISTKKATLTKDAKEYSDDKKEEKQDAEDIRQFKIQRQKAIRKMVACCLDLALPGSVIGWIPAGSGTVGILMLTTSILTGMDVWERCGTEVTRSQNSQVISAVKEQK